MSGERIYPLVIDTRYTVDIDNLNDWARYEAMVYAGSLDIVSPGRVRRPRPEKVKLIVSDFDGVFTDNRVWTDQHGKESVAGCPRHRLPGRVRRPRPEKVKLIVSDFDGVFTDNRVWTDQHGKEFVAGSRSDGLRIRELREQGIEVLILSSEENPVVVARAKEARH